MAVDRRSRSSGETIGAMLSAGTIRVAGLDVAYYQTGRGPSLLLVHGAAGDAREWRSQVSALSDDFTVIAWDEPGAGRSSDVPADFGLAGYATALAALIETLEAPAHVCGLSWGGTVTLELYRRRPELVATLVLADTYAGWKGSLPEHELRARVAGASACSTRPRRSRTRRFRGSSPVSRRVTSRSCSTPWPPRSVLRACASRSAQSPKPTCG